MWHEFEEFEVFIEIDGNKRKFYCGGKYEITGKRNDGINVNINCIFTHERDTFITSAIFGLIEESLDEMLFTSHKYPEYDPMDDIDY